MAHLLDCRGVLDRTSGAGLDGPFRSEWNCERCKKIELSHSLLETRIRQRSTHTSHSNVEGPHEHWLPEGPLSERSTNRHLAKQA
jgi:hypothetical protein